MPMRRVNRRQIAIAAAIRSGASRASLAQQFRLDERRLDAMGAEYADIPDALLFGINRLFDDNERLKRLIADLLGRY